MQVGMVFQNSALFDSLTVGDNVGFLLREHSSLPQSRIQARLHLLPKQGIYLLTGTASGLVVHLLQHLQHRGRTAAAQAVLNQSLLLARG